METVADREYFHVNVAHPYGKPLWQRAQTIETSDSVENPFFGFYSVGSRVFEIPVAGQAVPLALHGLRYFEAVRDGTVSGVSLTTLAGHARDVSGHWLTLAREFLFEAARLSVSPALPSRRNCIWLVETLEQAQAWRPLLGAVDRATQIVRVSATGTAHKADANLLLRENDLLPVAHNKARRYWCGEASANPQWEVLFIGT